MADHSGFNKDKNCQSRKFPLTTYFTCTLGEAATLDRGKSQSHATINDFLDHQAENNPLLPAVVFPVSQNDDQEWKHELLTFRDLRDYSVSVSHNLIKSLPNNSKIGRNNSTCVALLCPSSIDFLLTWLGLIRAGCQVLLISPKCSPEEITQLCRSCEVTVLFYDTALEETSKALKTSQSFKYHVQPIPWQEPKVSLSSVLQSKLDSNICTQNIQPSDTAYLHHTSGTTSGMPKPIPQSHFAAVGALPNFAGQDSATFTTTPLYHGGIADCFRAWTSNALIWLFPESEVAISAKNIIRILALAKTLEDTLPRVRYFSSVPYVLQILAEDYSGLSWLKGMELVGVGGAALPKNIGDSLVAEGVKLVSRYGSAECGFLLSSHREYELDKDWLYLSPPNGSSYLKFESQQDDSGLLELVVLPGWPHMAKKNRDDGSWATGDLFEPHPKTKDAWKYHSRNDGLITLVTGKKFDPSPLEDDICSSSTVISEVLIFGSGRQYPGALIFPKTDLELDSTQDLTEIAWKEIADVNKRAPAHARLSKEMLVIMQPVPNALARSSKGTILRKQAEEKYKSSIDDAYEEKEFEGETLEISDSEMLSYVQKVVQETLGSEKVLDPLGDLFYQGIDSTKCVQIRAKLQKALPKAEKLPWNVVYDQGTVERLSEFLIQVRNGSLEAAKHDETQLMLDLVEKYSQLEDSTQRNLQRGQKNQQSEKHTVLLTGATGTLGVNILSILRNNPAVAKIICLVRADDNSAARSRISKALLKAKKEELPEKDGKVLCLAATLSDSNFGVSETEFSMIQRESTIIIHTAWAVNFSLSLQSFVHDHIHGLQNLLNMIHNQEVPAKFVFCSSTASVLGPNSPQQISEEISVNPKDPDTLGYSRSKWVAEAICSRASRVEKLQGKISVLRIGQLTGDTENGVWNMKEAWPLMLSTSVPDVLNCLPALKERIAWLPVDIAAKVVVHISLSSLIEHNEVAVFHVASTCRNVTWMDVLSWIQRMRKPDGEILQTVSPRLWLEKLEALEIDHPAKQLLELWRKAYSDQESQAEAIEERKELLDSGPGFVTERTNKVLGGDEWSTTGVDEALIGKIWMWMEENL